jgi:hypothetical protein
MANFSLFPYLFGYIVKDDLLFITVVLSHICMPVFLDFASSEGIPQW